MGIDKPDGMHQNILEDDGPDHDTQFDLSFTQHSRRTWMGTRHFARYLLPGLTDASGIIKKRGELAETVGPPTAFSVRVYFL